MGGSRLPSVDEVAEGHWWDGDLCCEVSLGIEHLELDVGFEELLLSFADEVFTGDAHDAEGAAAHGYGIELKAVCGQG